MATKVTWREFLKKKMGPYMKKYGGHGPAIRQIAKEWRALKAKDTPKVAKRLKSKR